VTFLPDITTLRLFISVVEETSIARAARRERIAASAISKRISDIEQRLGVTLLRRHASGVEITAAGAAFLRHARRILQESNQLEGELRGLREGVLGLVRIAAGETTLVDYLPSVLGPFLKTHPGIRVELDERHHAEVLRAVQEQAADIGILPSEAIPDGLWHRPCYRDRLLAVMRRDHPLAGYPGVTMAELLDHDIIGQDRRGALGALLRRQAEALGRSMRSRIAADGWDIVYRLVREDLGIGIVAESSLRLFAPDPDIVSLPVLDAWARRQHRVCVRRLDALSEAGRLLLEQFSPNDV
jgi:DNA-binding transcriptional LysR family regulator